MRIHELLRMQFVAIHGPNPFSDNHLQTNRLRVKR